MNLTTPTTKFELLTAFGLNATVTMELQTEDGPLTLTGVILGLEHEDGTGESFSAKFSIVAEQGRIVHGYLGRFK